MKNIKVDEKSKFLSAVLLSILLIGLAFFFGYKKFEEKTSRLIAENSDLESRIKSLETYYITEEQNRKDTESMTKEIAQIFSAYPGDARFEDGIFEAFNLYSASGETLKFQSIGFASPASVKYIPAETVVAAGIEDYTGEINFNGFDVSYKGSLTYEGLKDMVREIATGKYNLAIGRMQYQITANGMIDGTSQLSFYYVKGANCPYTEPPVTEYQTGLENLFGVNGAVITNDEEENNN